MRWWQRRIETRRINECQSIRLYGLLVAYADALPVGLDSPHFSACQGNFVTRRGENLGNTRAPVLSVVSFVGARP